MDIMSKDELDPFRVIIGVLATKGDSDLLVGVANAARLRVDLTMSESDAVSNRTRIRTLLPRILAAYDQLSDSARLAVANVAIHNFGPSYPDTRKRAIEALVLIGWEVRGQELIIGSPELREMFFPKGSQWDGHVILRDVFNEAQHSLTIVDSYTDGTVFQMLAARQLDRLRIRILCGASGPTVATEAKMFMAQYLGVTVEVGQGKDFHDRFVVIDDRSCVHIGASIKDAGKTAFMVNRVEDKRNLQAILGALSAAWTASTRLI
jgi:hypothetical protein